MGKSGKELFEGNDLTFVKKRKKKWPPEILRYRCYQCQVTWI